MGRVVPYISLLLELLSYLLLSLTCDETSRDLKGFYFLLFTPLNGFFH